MRTSENPADILDRAAKEEERALELRTRDRERKLLKMLRMLKVELKMGLLVTAMLVEQILVFAV